MGMDRYRLYHVKDGRFVRFEETEAKNDVLALGEARRLAGDGCAELWSGARMIAEIKPR
jgi:hypothetical protein